MVKHCLTHDGRIGESDGGNEKYELDSIHACLYCLRIVRTRSKSVEQMINPGALRCRIESPGSGSGHVSFSRATAATQSDAVIRGLGSQES
jgi:hypothetical protein